MAAHVSYEKRLTSPPGGRLLFSMQGPDIVSEVISLKYKIKLLDIAPRPIELIRLTIQMLNPLIYEIHNIGKKMDIEYEDKSDDFVTQTINFKIKIVNPEDVLDKAVVFEVYVMDVDENIISPTDNSRFYSWIPSMRIAQDSPVISFFKL